jgi:hypothetical protein
MGKGAGGEAGSGARSRVSLSPPVPGHGRRRDYSSPTIVRWKDSFVQIKSPPADVRPVDHFAKFCESLTQSKDRRRESSQ